MSAGAGKMVKASKFSGGSGSNSNGGGAKKDNKDNTAASHTHKEKDSKGVGRGEKGKSKGTPTDRDKDTGGKKQKETTDSNTKKDRGDISVNARKDTQKGPPAKDMKGGKNSKSHASSSSSVSSAASSWQCPACTYVHANKEAAFLACKVCGTERSGNSSCYLSYVQYRFYQYLKHGCIFFL